MNTNNIYLLDEHVKGVLKGYQLSKDSAKAWQAFENKFHSITIASYSAAKPGKPAQNESNTELNIPKGNIKWLYLGLLIAALCVGAYFVWHKTQSIKQTPTPIKTDSVIPPQPVIIPPVTNTVKTDTVKTDSAKANLPAVTPATNLSSGNINTRNPTVTSQRPAIINKPKPNVNSVQEQPAKQEPKEEKKTEGEFDFFDKPSGTDTLKW